MDINKLFGDFSKQENERRNVAFGLLRRSNKLTITPKKKKKHCKQRAEILCVQVCCLLVTQIVLIVCRPIYEGH